MPQTRTRHTRKDYYFLSGQQVKEIVAELGQPHTPKQRAQVAKRYGLTPRQLDQVMHLHFQDNSPITKPKPVVRKPYPPAQMRRKRPTPPIHPWDIDEGD